MENKYYTPDIEELIFALINKDDIYSFENKIDENNIITESIEKIETYPKNIILSLHLFSNEFKSEKFYKLKYLDKEDIESFGFEQRSLPHQYKKDWYRLIKRREENQYIIEDGRYQDQIFVGTIKNKSELRKLLQQLGIC